jgi:hypothetical protein
MADWVNNMLSITGDSKEDIDRLFSEMGGIEDWGDKLYIDFDKIVPKPKELRIDVDGVEHIDAIIAQAVFSATKHENYEFIDNFLANPDFAQYKTRKDFITQNSERIPNILDAGLSYYKAYCSADWGSIKSWCSENWSVKSGAVQQELYEDERLPENHAVLFFQTAWTSALKMVALISRMYPTLVFGYRFKAEDNEYDMTLPPLVFIDGEWQNEQEWRSGQEW